jgi:DNA-binding NarL/FixJ family response regulator
MARADLQMVQDAARLLADQSGDGLPRRALVELAGKSPHAITLHAGDPMVALVQQARGTAPTFDVLTARERDVAERIAAGRTNRQIADELVISLATVKDHVHNILTKTALRNRSAVAALWHQG